MLDQDIANNKMRALMTEQTLAKVLLEIDLKRQETTLKQILLEILEHFLLTLGVILLGSFLK